MKKTFFIISFIFLWLSVTAQFTLHLSITDLPVSHPANETIYIAGTFNNWNPKDENYKFTKNANGTLAAILNLKLKTGEYKLTRGSWEKAECSKDGNPVANRQFNTEVQSPAEIIIEGWADKFFKKSTASANVKFTDTAFFIPQLNRSRTIRIYLPPDYENSRNRYPVLYMHDGQNLFDNLTAFSGEWGVDEFMDTTRLKKCIVVGIDNGGAKRLNEYCPYDFSIAGLSKDTLKGKGEGDAYVDFLVKTLKPFIDKNFRTLKNKPNTFISGSSMGGLISMYAVLKYPKLFGGAGVYSPAFWIAPGISDKVKTGGRQVNSKIYFFAGKQEGTNMVDGAVKMYDDMQKLSRSKMKLVIKDDGKHNEATWRKDFPEFYNWLMKPE